MWPLFILLGIIVFFISGGIHKIDEGHVGMYWRGGKLMEGTTEPGYHLQIPFITSYANIQVSVQTDRVENIPVYIRYSNSINSAVHQVV